MAIPVERGFEGGHGSHWDALLEDPGQLANIVRAAFRGSTPGSWQVVTLKGTRQRVRERPLPLGGAALEALVLELEEGPDRKPAVATVYPRMSAAGRPVEATPARILEWGDGLEAQVVANLGGGGQLAFFATDYYAHADAYLRGAPHAVSFSAIAYALGAISPAPRFEEVEGRRVDVSKAAVVAPLKDSDRAPYYDDDFFLQGPVTRVATVAYPPWDEGSVLELELPDLGKLPVFGRKKHFPHGPPKLGEVVAAYAWLQGRRASVP